MISAFLHFQQNSNRLFNNCTKILDKLFLKYEGGVGRGDPQVKTTLKKPSLIRVKSVNQTIVCSFISPADRKQIFEKTLPRE